MSEEFLPAILKQKTKGAGESETESLQPLHETYKLCDYLKNNAKRLQVIAEIERASLSLGNIDLDVNIVKQVKAYQDSGTAIISVLTDPFFFKGDIDYLHQILSQVSILTLAKDFIIDEKQIIRSYNTGATVVLLIVAVLPEARLKEFYGFTTGLGLEALFETRNLSELEVAHRIGAKVTGVSNHNLVTFGTDTNTSLELSAHFKKIPAYISESAIFTKDDAALATPFFNGILADTTLIKADNVFEKVKELQINKG